MAWNSKKLAEVVKANKPIATGTISNVNVSSSSNLPAWIGGASSHTHVPNHNHTIPPTIPQSNPFVPIGDKEIDRLAEAVGVKPISNPNGLALQGEKGAYDLVALLHAMIKKISRENLKLCMGCDEVRPMADDDYKCERCRSEGIED